MKDRMLLQLRALSLVTFRLAAQWTAKMQQQVALPEVCITALHQKYQATGEIPLFVLLYLDSLASGQRNSQLSGIERTLRVVSSQPLNVSSIKRPKT